MKKLNLIGVGGLLVASTWLMAGCSSDSDDNSGDNGGMSNEGGTANGGSSGSSHGGSGGTATGGNGGSQAGNGGTATGGTGGSTGGTGGSTGGTGGSTGGTGGDTGGTGGSGGTATGGSGGSGGTGPVVSADCHSYCDGDNGFVTFCAPTEYADTAACETACATQTNWKLSCRIDHLHNAVNAGAKAPHCFHADGYNDDGSAEGGPCADN